ncbi:uncharacterized protein LOC141716673 [Apium graveolens]|uniref:uncharacterized protein LOC141716673 n=1 Tax=Apium graveolens TaxID=4045 RepID=UPI003D78C30C
MRDFNDILYDSDKWGRTPRPRWMLEGFRSAIEDNHLAELDLSGVKFTWEKSKGKPGWVKERFENTWLHEPSFRQEVMNFWTDLPAINIIPNLISVSGFMAHWGRNFFHKFRDKIKKQKEVVAKLVDHVDAIGVELYFSEKDILQELLLHEESYWKQREKKIWLAEGDANTKFFHVSASTRRRKKHIFFLEDNQGNQIHDHDGMFQIVADYFSEIFKSSRAPGPSLNIMVDNQVTDSQNARLVEDITFEQFTIAVRQMHPDKASGPDGSNPVFFQ